MPDLSADEYKEYLRTGQLPATVKSARRSKSLAAVGESLRSTSAGAKRPARSSESTSATTTSKYRSRSVVMDGLSFASQWEADRWPELNLLQKAGVLSNLRRQVSIEVAPATTYRGERVRKIYYIADFVYEENGETVVEDAKGFHTKDWRIKWKLLKARYPELVFRVHQKPMRGKGRSK